MKFKFDLKTLLAKFKFPGKFDFKLSRPLVVVEIGNDWLKVLESQQSPAGEEITKIILVKLARITEGLIASISNIFKDKKVSREPVILSIPRHLVTFRILELPSVNPAEIGDIVNLQVGKQTPYSKEEIISAYKILWSERQGYTKVLLVIAQRSVIVERVDTLQKAGIAVKKVVISSEGVCNWFSVAYPELVKTQETVSTFVMLDIDSNYSDFLAMRKGQVAFSKSIFIGANHLIDQQETWQEKFIEELKRSLERFREETKSPKPGKIYLSGAAVHIADLPETLTAKLEIPVELTDTRKNFKINKDAGFAGDPDHRYVSITQVLGSTVRGKKPEIDLMPTEKRILRDMEKKRSQLTFMGIMLISIVMMICTMLAAGIYNKNGALAQLKQKITAVKDESAGIEKMRRGISLVEKRLDSRGSSLNLLSEISAITPSEINFTDIDISENDGITLRGRTSAMSNVFKFVKTLENSPVFENVKTTYAATKKEKKDDKENEYAEFEITCSYQQ